MIFDYFLAGTFVPLWRIEMKNLFFLFFLVSICVAGCGAGYEKPHTLPAGFQSFERYISLGSKPIEMGFFGQPVAGHKFLIYRFLDPNPENNCLLLTNAVIPVFAKRACLMEQDRGIYLIHCTLEEYKKEVGYHSWRINPPKK
ncbi:MAG: hypothetical protein PHY72_00860 [Candidatus Pacebacteria bacterium]|nr:hypothetical protein [Candidatus Paceibacterota bacterium]